MSRNTLLILLAVVFSWSDLRAAAEDQITIFIPAFEGGPVAMKVATFLNLKLWRTLRVPPKSENYDTSGMVLWSHQPLNGSSYEIAEEAAKKAAAQLVLWGSAVSLGDGAVVQCFLSIPEYEDSRTKNPEHWIVKLPTNTSSIDLEITIPRRRYEFSPITVKQKLLERYSLPSALVLYHSPNDRSAVGEVGHAFRALEHQGDYTKVKSKDTGVIGWIYVPELSADTEIVNFTGGLIRLLRADYAGASQLFRKVQRSDAGTSVKYDALLLQAISEVKNGEDPTKSIEAAIKMNPHLQAGIKFRIANLISRYLKAPDQTETKKLYADELAGVISENAYLFSPNDTWFAAAQRASAWISDATAKR